MKLKDLLPINEIEFRNQKEFDKYSEKHDLRPDTKVKIAGKTTTAGQAAKDSTKNSKPAKGTSVFGKGSSVFGSTPKKGKGNDEFEASYDLDDVADDIKGSLDVSDKDGKELQKRLEKGEKGKYNQTSETGGEIVFANGDRYEVGGTQDGPYPVTKKSNSGEDKSLMRKIKDFAGSKGFQFGARRPDDKEFSVANSHFSKYDNKKVGSVGVDKVTGNIYASNGEYEVILSPDGKLLKKDSVEDGFAEYDKFLKKQADDEERKDQRIKKIKSMFGLDEVTKKSKRK